MLVKALLVLAFLLLYGLLAYAIAKETRFSKHALTAVRCVAVVTFCFASFAFLRRAYLSQSLREFVFVCVVFATLLIAFAIAYGWRIYLEKKEARLLAIQRSGDSKLLIEQFNKASAVRNEQLKSDLDYTSAALQRAIDALKDARDSGKSSVALAAIERPRKDEGIDTGNPFADAALSSKKEQLEQAKLSLAVTAQIPIRLPLSPTEISAVIFNLIDNAANGLKSVDGTEVAFDCRTVAGQLAIVVRNACNPELSGEITAKQHTSANLSDDHGWGLSIVEHICSAHDGFCSFEAKDGTFTSTCMIPLQTA